jgi:type IX secretion system PorP/SprF family membrane protein
MNYFGILKNHFNILLFTIAVSLPALLHGQDPVFSQFYFAPTQLNPAFVGNTQGPNFYLNYRNQWPSINRAYVTYAASYDQFFKDIHSGFGFTLLADDAGNGILQTNKLLLQYSYRVRLGRDLYAKGGIEAGVIQQRLAWDQLIFYDQLDPEFGATTPGGSEIPTAEQPPDRTVLYNPDISFGVALFSETYYGGAVIKHLNVPDNSFYDDANTLSSGLPLRYTLHAGAQYTFSGARYKPGDPFLSPNIMFVGQDAFKQLNVGIHGGLGPVFGGVAYRHAWQNPDAVITSIGFRVNVLRIGYSYDITISDLSLSSGGAHEIGINFIMSSPDKIDYNDCFGLFR